MESPSSWSHLPKEIMSRIKNCLQSPSDISRFRSVCPSWRSSTPPLKSSFPFPDFLFDNKTKTNIHLSEITIYRFEPLIRSSSTPPTTWLVALEFVEGKHHFLNALTSFIIDPIPPIPKELNLCDFQITELHKVYGLQDHQHTTRKALFISSQYYDNTLLAVCASCLVFYKLENNEWVLLKEIDTMEFTDIELYQGKVWGVGFNGGAVVFTSSLEAIEVAPSLLPDDDANFYFIQSSGDLFVVELNVITKRRNRYIDSLLKGELLPIKIHKLVVEENRWIEMRHLDGQVFVLAREFPWSFSLPASEIPGGMGNCMVSSAISLDEYDSDDGVYDFFRCHSTTSSVWEIERDKYVFLYFCPGFDKLFWPPPKWLSTENPRDE